MTSNHITPPRSGPVPFWPRPCCLTLTNPAQAGPREDTLARMDEGIGRFRGLTAKVRKTTYTALIKESSEESGTMTLFRPKPKDLRMLIDFTKPDPRAVGFQGKKVQLYNPKLLLVQEYDLGKQGGLVEQFLLLGFGTPGSELAKSYPIKHLGEETVNGTKTGPPSTSLPTPPKHKKQFST